MSKKKGTKRNCPSSLYSVRGKLPGYDDDDDLFETDEAQAKLEEQGDVDQQEFHGYDTIRFIRNGYSVTPKTFSERERKASTSRRSRHAMMGMNGELQRRSRYSI